MAQIKEFVLNYNLYFILQGLDYQDGSTPSVLKAATLELKGHEGETFTA